MQQRASDGDAMRVPATLLDSPYSPAGGGAPILTRASGPVLAGTQAPSRSIADGTLTSLLDTRARLFMAFCTVGWLVCFVMFWAWWLDSSHLVTWTGLLINSALLFYLSYIPAYFIILVNRLRGVSTELALPDVRVAFVVTKAPSEPWPLARTTLLAMLNQRLDAPYDVWLCDEDPSEEVLAWCHSRGVRVSTRRGQPDYHRAQWPRRTKCKEGNLAFFYDRVGYRDYDVVAQLDCDHVPTDDYLTEIVRPFADPAIGYVAAPSICDANADQSWSARGRLFREATFHGPFQLGHHDGLAPLCIGSHYAVRTRALRDIGGIGPELAEDFSTTFLLTSAGWQGAFAHRAEAHGDGPHTFSAMLTQEYQWSRSLFTVLLELMPGHLRRLPALLRTRYLLALSYYPLLAVTTAAGLALPPIAAVTALPWVNVGYFEFLARWFSVSAWLILMTLFLRAQGLLRPTNAPIFSWEAWLFSLARWPYVARGVIAATAQRLRPRAFNFKVTPKTRHGLEPLPVALVIPYVTITAALAIAAVVGEVMHPRFSGYIALSILGSLTYCVVTFAICLLHAREAACSGGVSLRKAVRTTVARPLAAGLVAAIPLVVALTLAVEKVQDL